MWRQPAVLLCLCGGFGLVSLAWGANASVPPSAPAPSAAGAAVHFYIKAYRVKGGAHLLPSVEVEAAVYPYLGPYRTADDVEQARAALEKAYRDKGYETVAVSIPAQKVESGIITLQVAPNPVGRLRIHGSRYIRSRKSSARPPRCGKGPSRISAR